MTAPIRAPFARALARVCFLLLFQSTGLYLPQLLAQSPVNLLRKQITSLQPAATQSAPALAAALNNVPLGVQPDQAPSALDPTAPGAKKPGTHRVGLMPPVDGMSSAQHNSEAMLEAQKNLLAAPNLEAVSLHSTTVEQALTEARAMDCDYVLSSTLTQQQADAPKPSRFGKLMNLRTVQLAATAAQFVPAVQGAALVTNLVAGQALSMPMLNLTRTVKANSDVRYEYTLTNMDGTVRLHDTETLRSAKDSEDVLTPLLTGATKKLLPEIAR